MVEIAHSFDDSVAYERFMGQWSRAAGPLFLDWAAAPVDALWLDVGCGTGIFTELILDTCSPRAVHAIDPAQAQIDHVLRQPLGQRASFSVADSQLLPFPDAMFDVVASALVINFIPDRSVALSEMRRVARLGGLVAGFVWNFAAESSPSWPMRRGMRLIGMDVPESPGTKESTLDALRSLFEAAGFESIGTTCFDVAVPFYGFEDFWQAQTPSYSPIGKLIAAMTTADRANLMGAVRQGLPMRTDGRIEYAARANAIKALV